MVLSLKEYQKMVEEIEELEDIKQYDAVKKRNETSIPFEQYLKQRKKRKDA